MQKYNNVMDSSCDLANSILEQDDLEHRTDIEYGAERLRNLLEEAAAGNLELPRASRIISGSFEAVHNYIDEHKETTTRGAGAKYRNWLRAVPTDVVALVSIRVVLKACLVVNRSGGYFSTLQNMAEDIGRQLETEVRVMEARKVNPLYMSRVERNIKDSNVTSVHHLRSVYQKAYTEVMKGEMDSRMTNTELIHLGKFGVDACWKAGLIELEQTYDKQRTSSFYVLPDEIREYLLGYDEKDVINAIDPSYGAMVCPPDPWKGINGGGYISPRRKAAATLMPLRNMRREHIKVIREQFTEENMPDVFECANYLQGQAYSIHGPTLEVVKRLWFEGGGVMGIPTKQYGDKPEFPLPLEWDKKDGTEEELAVFSKWRREAQSWYYGNRQWQSRVRDVGGLIRTSDFYSDRPVWFPVFMDSRGRWYYRGSPNPQGTQIAKGVLHFHEKKPLGDRGVFWLKVHIANSFGFDKARMVDRAKWTEDNWDSIEGALDRPEDYPEVWGDDNPIVMYTAAYELREAYRSGRPDLYETGVPVHLDATCSGIQHFSALLRDPVGARHVNLFDAGGETKEDIYQAVASASYHKLTEQRTSGDEGEREGAAPWIDLGVSRDLSKRPVMTYVYGVTLHTTRDYIHDYTFDEHPEAYKSINNHQVTTLARALFGGIESALPATVNGMKWLHKVVRDVGREERLTWTLPTGFIVQHDYQTYEDKRVRVASAGIDRVIIREYTDGVRLRGMVNAISPNFIHALDAAHLTMTALACKEQGLAFSAVHDSFGTHPSDVDDLAKNIRDQFISLYSNDIIGDFIKDVGTEVSPPPVGDFDLNRVATSEFFFG